MTAQYSESGDAESLGSDKEEEDFKGPASPASSIHPGSDATSEDESKDKETAWTPTGSGGFPHLTRLDWMSMKQTTCSAN